MPCRATRIACPAAPTPPDDDDDDDDDERGVYEGEVVFMKGSGSSHRRDASLPQPIYN